METLLNNYFNLINASSESKMKYLEGEIHDTKRFIDMYYKEDPVKYANEIKWMQEEIISMKDLIESIKNGNISKYFIT